MSRKRNTKPTPKITDGMYVEVFANLSETAKRSGNIPWDLDHFPCACIGRPSSAKKRCETCGNRALCNIKLLYGTHCDAWCERGVVHVLMAGTLARKDGKYQYATDAGGESELSARDHAIIDAIRKAIETIINDANNGGRS